MRRKLWFGAAGLTLLSGLAAAQDAPRSILPPGFGNPTPAPTPTPSPAPTPTTPSAAPQPGTAEVRRQPGEIVQPLPSTSGSSGPQRTVDRATPTLTPDVLEGLPSLEELERLIKPNTKAIVLKSDSPTRVQHSVVYLSH